MTDEKPVNETKLERRVDKKVVIDASIDEVWKALTDAKELARWFPLARNLSAGPVTCNANAIISLPPLPNP